MIYLDDANTWLAATLGAPPGQRYWRCRQALLRSAKLIRIISQPELVKAFLERVDILAALRMWLERSFNELRLMPGSLQ
jgi:hypothetical protein